MQKARQAARRGVTSSRGSASKPRPSLPWPCTLTEARCCVASIKTVRAEQRRTSRSLHQFQAETLACTHLVVNLPWNNRNRHDACTDMHANPPQGMPSALPNFPQCCCRATATISTDFMLHTKPVPCVPATSRAAQQPTQALAALEVRQALHTQCGPPGWAPAAA